MGETKLKKIIEEASIYGGVVVFRGFKDGDIKETMKFLTKVIKEREGVIIDPELFKEYGIKRIPSYVLTRSCEGKVGCKKVYDRLDGNVSVRFALEKFAKR